MYKLLAMAAVMALVLAAGAESAFAQRGESLGIWKPHFGNASPGRSSASGGRSFGYAQPQRATAVQPGYQQSYAYRGQPFGYAQPQPRIAVQPEYRTFSIEPLGFGPGDTVVVNRDNVNLMLGRNVIGVVPAGAQFKVTKVVNGWLGAVLTVDGKEHRGWIWNGNVRRSDTAPVPSPGA